MLRHQPSLSTLITQNKLCIDSRLVRENVWCWRVSVFGSSGRWSSFSVTAKREGRGKHIQYVRENRGCVPGWVLTWSSIIKSHRLHAERTHPECLDRWRMTKLKQKSAKVQISVYYKGRSYIRFRVLFFIMEFYTLQTTPGSLPSSIPSAVIWIQQVLI